MQCEPHLLTWGEESVGVQIISFKHYEEVEVALRDIILNDPAKYKSDCTNCPLNSSRIRPIILAHQPSSTPILAPESQTLKSHPLLS